MTTLELVCAEFAMFYRALIDVAFVAGEDAESFYVRSSSLELARAAQAQCVRYGLLEEAVDGAHRLTRAGVAIRELTTAVGLALIERGEDGDAVVAYLESPHEGMRTKGRDRVREAAHDVRRLARWSVFVDPAETLDSVAPFVAMTRAAIRGRTEGAN